MTLTANISTRLSETGNPLLSFRLPVKSTRQRLRVRAVANLAGWYVLISDYESREVIHRDIGELPDGFTFNQATAELYGLACAKRWLDCNLPGAVVAMVNTAQPMPRREAKGRRAA